VGASASEVRTRPQRSGVLRGSGTVRCPRTQRHLSSVLNWVSST